MKRFFYYRLFLVIAVVCFPILASAQDNNMLMPDANLDEASLPRYRYSLNKDLAKAKIKDASTRQAHLKEMLTKYEQMPEYMKKAIEVAVGESKGSLRTDKPSVDYDAQELRGQLLNHTDDVSKMERILSILYGDPNVPYRPVEKKDDARITSVAKSQSSSQSVAIRYYSSSTARMRPKREGFRGRIYRKE